VAVKGIVFGHGMAVKVGKAAQRVAVIDAFAQLAVIPVLDAHENQRAQSLRGGDAVAPGGRLLQTAHQIQADFLDQGGMLIEEFGDTAQGGVELNALAL
jgi:hypothetical protein